jgi:peptide/nickel transport system ATP-binding protein
MTADETILRVERLTKVFRPQGRGAKPIVAAHEVSFSLDRGEVLALVGESGSGKTTIARMIAGIEIPTSGQVWVAPRPGVAPRQRVQMVFQDPYAAVNPFNRLDYTLTRPLINFRHLSPSEARQAAADILKTVHLTPPEEYLAKRPHQLSGGQRQRVVIARALAAQPELIVADEPVAMLDVSIRADVLQLLRDLLDQGHVSAMLYITHDLLTARILANRIMVLYRGHVVETGDMETIIVQPRHPYTQLLWASIPNPRRAQRGGSVHVPVEREDVGTEGCPFAPRCPLVQDVCLSVKPRLVTMDDGREVSCHVVAPEPDASRAAGA